MYLHVDPLGKFPRFEPLDPMGLGPDPLGIGLAGFTPQAFAHLWAAHQLHMLADECQILWVHLLRWPLDS